MKGKGRAFCAGGDVAAVVHHIHEGMRIIFCDAFTQTHFQRISELLGL